MWSPRDRAKEKRSLPRGGKAAARAREFALKHGLDPKQSKIAGEQARPKSPKKIKKK
jgi:hypothetical protein